MQKFINFASFFCAFIVLIIACTVNEGIFGRWENISHDKFFSDIINIVKLRSKEGANFPYYTLIYDNNFYASACQQAEQDRTFCVSFLLKTVNIHPTDEISSVIASPLKDRDYLVTTKLENKLGYTLLHWQMTFPESNNQVITQTFRRNWF
ncbi:MAG: hypothetical protein IJ660_00320 [Alphaproteobacteria bacterium]|nr:hypothetical protein [Alphaproteobacteria bacterium]